MVLAARTQAEEQQVGSREVAASLDVGRGGVIMFGDLDYICGFWQVPQYCWETRYKAREFTDDIFEVLRV